jgi:hypothetical protein
MRKIRPDGDREGKGGGRWGGSIFDRFRKFFSVFTLYVGQAVRSKLARQNVDFYFSNPNSVMIGFIMIRRAFTDLVNVNNNKSFRSKCQNNGLRRVDGD